MPDINLDDFSTDELKEMVKRIEDELEHRRVQEIKQTAIQIRKLAASVGKTAEEVMTIGSHKKSKSQPKYQNPDDPKQTWTGRGKRPNWFREAIARGKVLKELEIQE